MKYLCKISNKSPYKPKKSTKKSKMKTKQPEEKITKSKKSKSRSKIRKATKPTVAQKKAMSAKADMILVDYFLKNGKSSIFAKLVNFYEKSLKQPLLALILKKFLIHFKDRETHKQSMGLKRYVVKLRRSKGIARLIKKEKLESA